MCRCPVETRHVWEADCGREDDARGAACWDRTDFGLVFAQADGTPLSPATVSRRFSTLVADTGVPTITLHGLRHTFATLALLDGIPSKVVAEILGHSSTRVTEDVYQHVTPGMQADATTRVAALIREGR